MVSVHVFKNEEDGLLYTPSMKVSSYGLLDLILCHDTFESLSKKCDKVRFEIKDDDIKEHVLWGVVINIDLKYLNEVYKSEPKLLDEIVDLENQRAQRAKHYTTKENQVTKWVRPEVRDNSLRLSEYAVICDRHDGRKKKGVVIHSSCESAVSAMNADGISIDETGYYKKYMSIFGANESFMERYTALEKELSGKILSKFRNSDELFREKNETFMMEFLKDCIMSDPKVKKFGTVNLLGKNGESIATAPKLPLICWATRYLYMEGTPVYKAVSPSGLRMNMDCRYHSDWLIASGVGLDKSSVIYKKANEAALKWCREWLREMFSMEHHVLSSAEDVKGRLFFANESNASEVQEGDIVVVPEGSVKYQLHLDRACKNGKGGIITESGSSVVHLAKVCRERRIPVLRIPNAREILVEGLNVVLRSSKGKVSYE